MIAPPASICTSNYRNSRLITQTENSAMSWRFHFSKSWLPTKARSTTRGESSQHTTSTNTRDLVFTHVRSRRMRAPKILMIENSIRGGYGRYARDLSAALTEKGGNVLYLASRNHDIPVGIGEQVQPLLHPLSPKMKLDGKSKKCEFVLRKIVSSLLNFAKIHKCADQFVPDIIHFHRTVPITYTHLVPALRRRCPVVLTVHDVSPHRGEKILSKSAHLRKLYGSFNRLIVHSEANREEIIREYECPADRIIVIPHGTDSNVEPVPKAEARQLLELPQADQLVLFLGSIRSNKRVDLLISACSKAFAPGDGKHLVIAGKPMDVSEQLVRAMLSEQGMGNRTTLRFSWLSDEALDLYLNASDVCVLPYVDFHAQSGILMRALTHGTPAIVTNGGSLAEVVTQGDAGLVFPSSDVESLAERIRTILASDSLPARYSRNGRLLSQSLYDWRVVADKTIEMYRELMLIHERRQDRTAIAA